MAETVAILGAGAWGTTLAVILARRGYRAILCARRRSHRDAMRSARANETYLSGIQFPDGLEIAGQSDEAVARADFVVLAAPSRYARLAMSGIAGALAPDTVVISATKGIEDVTLSTMSRMIAEVAPQSVSRAVLSGPGFAAEVARGLPAALVAAASEIAVARRVQELFSGPALRVYSSTDAIGVEICGAVKNVIAIAAGACDGLALGSSARAAVITRGIAELMRLVAASGGRRETAAGLAGLGDLVLTCTGELSRNRAAGLALARGLRPQIDTQRSGASDENAHGPVAEGIASARPIRALAARLGVEMPIVNAVCRALYEGQTPNAMVEELLNRELKAEF
jgi:glycerol-3-phosphate dehydrogenase (NAD(P)+)